MRFKEFLNEKFLNLFSSRDKRIFVDVVWEILQRTYAPLGGIKGSGFSSKEDMVNNIPFWKLLRRGDKILAVQLYKDSNGRKFVAAGTDGSREGKEALKKILTDELTLGRSYGEISENVLKALANFIGEEQMKSFIVDPSEVEAIIQKPIFFEPGDLFYLRDIHGHKEKKFLIGKPKKFF